MSPYRLSISHSLLCIKSIFADLHVWTSEAHWEWVILPFLTLHTSHCLNSPTSQPLVNVGISILAFPLFVLFACVIRVVLQLECSPITVELRDIFHDCIHPPQQKSLTIMNPERLVSCTGGEKARRQKSLTSRTFSVDILNMLPALFRRSKAHFSLISLQTVAFH